MADNVNGVADDANRLYWTSEMSVADVARHLDISRRALYAMIRPQPADAPCERCGGVLSHANRTARDAGRAECLECADGEAVTRTTAGVHAPAATVPPDSGAAIHGTTGNGAADEGAAGSDAEPAHELLPEGSQRRRQVQLGGLALVGALVGVGVTFLATRD